MIRRIANLKALDSVTKDQIIALKLEGKSNGEIIDYMRDNEQLEISTAQISNLMFYHQKQGKRKYRRGTKSANETQPATISGIVEEVISEVRALEDAFRDLLLIIRDELIRSRKSLKSFGEEV